MRDDSGPPQEQEQEQTVSDEGRLTRTVAKWRCLTSSDHRRAERELGDSSAGGVRRRIRALRLGEPHF